MKRSDRHKPENQNNKPNVNNEPQQNNAKPDEGKLSKYVNKDQIDKGKKFFSGKLSAYNTQLKEENKILKEKFTNIRTGNARQERDPDQKRPIIPIIVTGILLLPITILLAFLLITNFLPDEGDMNRIASNDATDDTEETEDGETSDDETADDDTEVAVVDENEDESAEDIDTSEDIPEQEQDQEIQTIADYSATERQQLQRAAQAAVNEKNAEIALIREQQAAERARQQAAEEEARRQEEQAQTEDTEDETEEETADGESDSPLAGNQVHVVTGEDNLYRIAIQYYGDGSAANVQRIRDANGISGDSLSLGQELIIP